MQPDREDACDPGLWRAPAWCRPGPNTCHRLARAAPERSRARAPARAHFSPARDLVNACASAATHVPKRSASPRARCRCLVPASTCTEAPERRSVAWRLGSLHIRHAQKRSCAARRLARVSRRRSEVAHAPRRLASRRFTARRDALRIGTRATIVDVSAQHGSCLAVIDAPGHAGTEQARLLRSRAPPRRYVKARTRRLSSRAPARGLGGAAGRGIGPEGLGESRGLEEAYGDAGKVRLTAP